MFKTIFFFLHGLCWRWSAGQLHTGTPDKGGSDIQTWRQSVLTQTRKKKKNKPKKSLINDPLLPFILIVRRWTFFPSKETPPRYMEGKL